MKASNKWNVFIDNCFSQIFTLQNCYSVPCCLETLIKVEPAFSKHVSCYATLISLCLKEITGNEPVWMLHIFRRFFVEILNTSVCLQHVKESVKTLIWIVLFVKNLRSNEFGSDYSIPCFQNSFPVCNALLLVWNVSSFICYTKGSCFRLLQCKTISINFSSEIWRTHFKYNWSVVVKCFYFKDVMMKEFFSLRQ